MNKDLKLIREKHKTFCALPWIHLSTRPNGLLRVCCTANASAAGVKNDKKWDSKIGILRNDDGRPANLNDSDLESAWNNSYMRDIRKKMLNGEVPASCTKCFKEEASGHISKRIWESNYWSQRIDLKQLLADTSEEGEVPPKLYYIDLRLGSKCNLKCIMCSPHDSSLWVSDHKKLFDRVENKSLKQHLIWDQNGTLDGGTYNWHQNNDRFWQQLFQQIPHMKQLYFAGGESTIIEEHYELLQECIDRGFSKNIELRYNSNGIELPDRLFKMWDQFKRVRFHFSIDAYGELNDYIRFPSKWSNIEARLEQMDKTPDNIEVTIACAVQALNIYYIPEFIKWKLSKNYKKINPWPLGAGLMNFHLVYLPAFLNIKVLPAEMKRKIADKYEKFYQWLEEHYRSDEDFLQHEYGIKRLRGMIKFMMSEDWSERLPQFKEYVEKMDLIRGTRFGEVFPELVLE